MSIGLEIVRLEAAERAMARYRARKARARGAGSQAVCEPARLRARSRNAKDQPRRSRCADRQEESPQRVPATGRLSERCSLTEEPVMRTEDRTNLETFEALFLSLGPDVVKLDGSRHDAELMTAKASAAGRWLRIAAAGGAGRTRSRDPRRKAEGTRLHAGR